MTKNKLLLVALIAASILIPGAVRAQGISIQVGDRPYYSHGDRYWAGDYQMIWVSGHMRSGHWVHGHYMRGEHRRHDWDRHHDNDRHDDHR